MKTGGEYPCSLGRNLTVGLLDVLGCGIVTGRFDRTGFPTEGEITKQHRVSHTVTREAVKMLAAKGLVTARPRQGTVIEPSSSWNLFDVDVLRWLLERELSPELVEQLRQLRVAIEPEAAALAARFASSADLRCISRAVDRVDAALAERDDPLSASIAFHVTILESAQNPFYSRFRETVATALHISQRLLRSAASSGGNISDYLDVCNAIFDRDPVAAHSTMLRLVEAPPEGCTRRL